MITGGAAHPNNRMLILSPRLAASLRWPAPARTIHGVWVDTPWLAPTAHCSVPPNRWAQAPSNVVRPRAGAADGCPHPARCPSGSVLVAVGRGAITVSRARVRSTMARATSASRWLCRRDQPDGSGGGGGGEDRPPLDRGCHVAHVDGGRRAVAVHAGPWSACSCTPSSGQSLVWNQRPWNRPSPGSRGCLGAEALPLALQLLGEGEGVDVAFRVAAGARVTIPAPAGSPLEVSCGAVPQASPANAARSRYLLPSARPPRPRN